LSRTKGVLQDASIVTCLTEERLHKLPQSFLKLERKTKQTLERKMKDRKKQQELALLQKKNT
jgi:hypothetical protein